MGSEWKEMARGCTGSSTRAIPKKLPLLSINYQGIRKDSKKSKAIDCELKSKCESQKKRLAFCYQMADSPER